MRPLGLELRGDGADPATQQIVSSQLARVAPVIRDRPRPQFRPARTILLDRTSIHQLWKWGPLVPLSGRQDERHRPAVLITA